MNKINVAVLGLAAGMGLLAGCSTTTVVMRVDPSLQGNATVYQINYPDSLADKLSGKRLNVRFGPYRIKDADLSWTASNMEAEDPAPLFSVKKVEQSGNSSTTTEISGGPTSLFGFSRPVEDGQPGIKREARTITYTFVVDQEATWRAHCEHHAEKRVIQYETSNSVEILSSEFRCLYRESDKGTDEKGSWLLAVDTNGLITMTQQGKPNMLTAFSTGGERVTKDGKHATTTTGTVGYTWSLRQDGGEKNVAAIAVNEEKPRVLIDKTIPESLSHVLAMASAGMLIYGWEIHH